MNSSAFQSLLASVRAALSEHRLLDALIKLEELAAFASDAKAAEATRTLRQDYAMLLGCMKSGMDDAERDDNFCHFLRKAYRISDMLYRHFTLRHTTTHEAQVWRRLHQSPEALAEVYVPLVEGGDGMPATLRQIISDPLASYQQLFDTVLTSTFWTADDRHLLYRYIMTSDASRINKLTLVSAVGMSLLFCFDEEKFLLLLSVIEEDHVEVSVRALVMSVLAYAQHHDRLPLYTRITLKFDFLRELTYFHPLVVKVQQAFYVALESPRLAYETDKNIPVRLKQAFEHEQHDVMLDAMHDYISLLQIGVDLNYHTFDRLHRVVPFFNEAANWFCPFSFNHPLFYNIDSALRLIGSIVEKRNCDTDRFNMVFMMSPNIPEIHVIQHDETTHEERTLDEEEVGDFVNMLSREVQQREAKQDSSLLTLEPEQLERMVYGCVLDAHRFFNLFEPQRATPNPFKADLDIWQSPTFAEIFATDEARQALSKTFFDFDHYDEALSLLETLEPTAQNQIRKGLCCHQLHQHTEAVQYFCDAWRLGPDSVDFLGSLSESAIEAGDFESPIPVFEQAFERNPEDEDLLECLAKFYTLAHQYAKAQRAYEKLHYLHPERPLFREVLTEVLLRQGKRDQVMHHLTYLIEQGEASSEAFLRAGHCTLLGGDIPSALIYYQEALKADGKEYAPADFFNLHSDFLQEQGVGLDTQRQIIDLLNL